MKGWTYYPQYDDYRPRGEGHYKAKLREKDVLFIRSSSLHNRVLAMKFGVSIPTIYKIKDGETWKHLLPEETS
jgi:hypothetical protein